MNELYDEKVWQDAYQSAEERGLDDIDAREQSGDELAAAVAGFSSSSRGTPDQ
ncbi:hypothetical protein [Streptomyces sp. ALI-76-A]|uniref:hypothetical protein n=1 Tax=Streptomyces sp. ALI-76-A TaxID=3025736 RepID=UPI00256EFA4B|nr:hypothetical protein [Streptomyces sp. ALI-76-A]MDL5199671.1 hypothetical protein [Streptomyces sp. ALI-76-A]